MKLMRVGVGALVAAAVFGAGFAVAAVTRDDAREQPVEETAKVKDVVVQPLDAKVGSPKIAKLARAAGLPKLKVAPKAPPVQQPVPESPSEPAPPPPSGGGGDGDDEGGGGVCC